jgi:DNA-binding transcriptional regulator LsrR (DeoR family)
MEREETLLAAASMYYLQDLKMEAIASRLNMSRSSISRMLKQARESGLVEIKLRPTQTRALGLGRLIGSRFGVDVSVVPVADTATTAERLDGVAVTTARLVTSWFDSEMVLGVAWGTTVGAISAHLGKKATRESSVVQLNGAANYRSSGVEYAGRLIARFGEAFGATMHLFPVPAFFDFAETRQAMWRERSVARVLEVQRRVDIALFSVGSIGGELPSHVYSAGYLGPADVEALETENVVGDVCTVFLRADGTYEDISLNQRATGPTPAELRRIPRRVCAVAGDSKVAVLSAALRAGTATHLVIDEQTAFLLAEQT